MVPGREHPVARHGTTVPRGLEVPDGRFGRMFPGRAPCEAGEREIEALVALLEERQGVTQNSDVPAGFTYLGQFIDHDITFDPTPFADRQRDPHALVNFRTPRLDLDSVYGLGPDVQPYLYDWESAPKGAKLLIGEGEVPDLPRNDQDRALTGDPRNDENAIVSQLHLLFLRFHNRAVEALGSFEAAQRTVRRHFQWIVLREYLPKVLGDGFGGPREHFTFAREPFIPVEFSGAAFRFGHSMVRDDYGIRKLPPVGLGAGALPLFPDLDGFKALRPEKVIDWERFFELAERSPQSSSAFDTRLAPPLFDLPFGESVLARRTLLRGARLGLPSGQEIAGAMELPALEEPDLLLGDLAGEARDVLVRSTPLWYWLLCEAQKGGGRHLGPVGGRIVGEVLLGLLEGDPGSFLNEEPGWEPGVLGGGRDFTMASLVRFAQGG